MRPSRLRCWLLLFFALLSFPYLISAQTESFCAFGDPATVDTMLAYAGQYHEFGADSLQWPHEFKLDRGNEFKAFRQVFKLYLTDHISGRFSTPEWVDILHAIMNNDTTSTMDDVFSSVWDYFTRPGADGNPAYAGVRFRYFPGTYQYTNLNIYLFHEADINEPYSSAGGNSVWIRAGNETVPWILGQGIAHELQHLCFAANGSSNGKPGGYYGVNESLSTLAEYFLDGWRHIVPNNLAYDASFMDSEPCDIPLTGTNQSPKYNVYKAWLMYVYEACKANPTDPTDDLLYRWIRNDAALDRRLLLNTLADLLWSDSNYDWLGGSDATDRLNRLYANFLAAKFCNASNSSAFAEFGTGSVNTLTDLGFFTDNNSTPTTNKTPESPVDCPPYENSQNNAAWNVRVLTPKYELGSGNHNAMTTKAGLYYDADSSADSIDVYAYGTDYVEFRAGAYFEDGDEHELRIEINGRGKESATTKAIRPVGWIIGYSCSDDTLQVHPEHLVFVEPLAFQTSSLSGGSVNARTVIVSDFGRSIRAVVLAVGAATLRPDLWFEPVNGITYQYAYGVYTPASTSRSWAGDVYALGDVSVASGGALGIEAGTRVHVFGSDLAQRGTNNAKIELRVSGALAAEGTEENPILFESWHPQGTNDWVGISFDSQSDGGSFDHCRISRASTAIDSRAPLSVTSTEIDSCYLAGIASRSGGALVEGCEISSPGFMGIEVESDSLIAKRTTVTGAAVYGLAAVVTGSASVDSSCVFTNNDTGVYFDETGRRPTLRNSTIDDNSSLGVLCETEALIETNTISGNDGAGIMCQGGRTALIQTNTLSSNGVAVDCSFSSPTIAGNTITSNETGVWVSGLGSAPDIGHDSNSGGNTIASSAGYHIVNFPGTGTIVNAQNNCWGITSAPCDPPRGKLSGYVDASSALCCGQSMLMELPASSSSAPVVTGLGAISPNPFNPTTTIHFNLASRGTVEIRVYDVAGGLVCELVGGTRPAGTHYVVWDGSNRRGGRVTSGVYFVRMTAAGQTFTKKMVLLK